MDFRRGKRYTPNWSGEDVYGSRELRYDSDYYRGEAEREAPAHVDVCVFKDGKHVRMGLHCPHFDYENEMGPNINPSWTAQWPD